MSSHLSPPRLLLRRRSPLPLASEWVAGKGRNPTRDPERCRSSSCHTTLDWCQKKCERSKL